MVSFGPSVCLHQDSGSHQVPHLYDIMLLVAIETSHTAAQVVCAVCTLCVLCVYSIYSLSVYPGSDDGSVRFWEVRSSRCMKTVQVGGAVKSVAWNPNPSVCLLAVAL